MTSNIRPIGLKKVFRVYCNRPLRNLPPVVQCVVCEFLLPLASFSLIAAVMVIAASSNTELVLELLYNGFYSYKIAQQTQFREKLVYVKTNMGMLYDYSHDSSQIKEEDELISDYD